MGANDLFTDDYFQKLEDIHHSTERLRGVAEHLGFPYLDSPQAKEALSGMEELIEAADRGVIQVVAEDVTRIRETIGMIKEGGHHSSRGNALWKLKPEDQETLTRVKSEAREAKINALVVSGVKVICNAVEHIRDVFNRNHSHKNTMEIDRLRRDLKLPEGYSWASYDNRIPLFTLRSLSLNKGMIAFYNIEFSEELYEVLNNCDNSVIEEALERVVYSLCANIPLAEGLNRELWQGWVDYMAAKIRGNVLFLSQFKERWLNGVTEVVPNPENDNSFCLVGSTHTEVIYFTSFKGYHTEHAAVRNGEFERIFGE